MPLKSRSMLVFVQTFAFWSSGYIKLIQDRPSCYKIAHVGILKRQFYSIVRRSVFFSDTPDYGGKSDF